ncbi:DNA translocase FtsK [Fodinisporobacter ferrooxydans]|uniref:DNA translocase FtsK n=1 Tax=Fodinisporobacter ferrooxydans TaxID=2901836 RepID=A0ABY4CFW0_9BACL|nr:DNA translocase FtsK [Alicyclobacillaceae bacterium MYW30-H2]
MAKKKIRAKKQIAKGSFIKYETIGLLIVTVSALGLADLGWVGKAADYISIFLAGDWHFLLPLYFIYLAIYIMIKRGPITWTLRQSGLLLLLLIVLTWSHLNVYTALLDQHPDTKPDLFQVTIDNIHQLYKSETTIIDANKPAIPVTAGGGLIGYMLFSATHYLFDTTGTLIVLITGLLIGLIMITKRSLVMTVRKWNRSVYERINNGMRKLSPLFKLKKRNKRSGKGVAIPIKYTPRADVFATEDLDGTHEPSDFSPLHEVTNELLINDFADQIPQVNTSAEESTHIETNPAESRITIRWPERNAKSAGADFKSGKHADDSRQESSAIQPITFENAHELPYELPGYHLLDLPKNNRSSVDQKDLTANAKKLKTTLESFGVLVSVNEIHRGPTVTRYEIQPAVGVKVSRIVNLADDLALALAARDIRIEAPIPGKSAIGIEVPNLEVAVVSLREVLETSEFQNAESKLTIGFGRDISGTPIIGNLAKMPHLLVAGATGSGKSVCINGIITSILFRAKPYEVKFILIDPKMVELNVYNGIPHLLTPVVTDPRKAAYALKKVVAEMESRYELFAKEGTRDIDRYNVLAVEKGETPLPYIVVIIDELADLMMVAPGDVEDAICRIAQMARAAGIHLIVATQRPSVDVITGVIKANIPSRIAFAVSSQADSRTILDGGGAEKLLGRGDMLYLPAGASKPVRVQGAFLSDQEVEQVVHFVKQQQPPSYTVDLTSPAEDVQKKQESVDDLFYDAVRLVVESQQASVSMLQRRLKVGYARAARLVDQMEERGIVGPFEGSKPRDVLLTKEQLEQMDNAG